MLDIHLGRSKESAAKTAPRFQLEETLHAKLFAGTDFNGAKYQKITKIKDYYSDASFLPEELPELIKELDEILNRLSSDAPFTKALQTFRSICETALQADETLFCFAD